MLSYATAKAALDEFMLAIVKPAKKPFCIVHGDIMLTGKWTSAESLASRGFQE